MAVKAKAKEKKQGKKESARQSDPQTAKETLLLWAILGEGGGKDVSRAILEQKGMLFSNDRKARDGLERQGLIRVEQRTTHNEQGRPVRGIWMKVTNSGLEWAEENLAVMPAKSQVAAPILKAWLSRFSILMQTRKISMAEFLEPHSGVSSESGISLADSSTGEFHEDSPAVMFRPEPSRPNGNYEALRARIRHAYLELTGGRLNTRALLSDLRQKLKDIDRPVLDAALKKMQSEEEASLYQLDNRVEVTDADRAAAIHFGGEPRHILWIER